MISRQKIKLAINVPCVIELDDARGIETKSQFSDGPEYRYHCSWAGSPSLLYLPVDGHLAIKRSGAGAGDEIELTKAKANNGSIIYQCRRLSDAHAIEAPPQRDAPTPVAPREIRLVAPAPQPAQPQQPYTRGATAPQREPVKQVHPIATVHPLQEMMTRCLEVAYYANQAAYNNLRAQGVEIDAPTWEDVRASGTTFFIQRMKGGN
jgi:hypothetical protein